MLTEELGNIVSDKEHQQELVKLYNDWYNDIKFSSHINLENAYWLKLKAYCIDHKKELIEFFFDLVNDLGTSGHFLMMMSEVWPDMIKVCEGDYLPFNIMEQIWVEVLNNTDINAMI